MRTVLPLAPTLIESMRLPLNWPDNSHSIALSPNIDRKHVSTLNVRFINTHVKATQPIALKLSYPYEIKVALFQKR